MRTIRTVFLSILLITAAACSSAGGSPQPSPGGSPVTSPEAALARVQAEYPEFGGLGPLDPDVIGACCFSEVKAVDGGYQVVVTVGWGDCPAGCINRHTWTFLVSPDGQVGLIGEGGPAVPPDVMPRGEG